MTIRDSVDINAPIEEIWRWIENPETMPQWNPKVKKVVALSPPYCVDYTYGITYQMSGKTSEFSAQFVEHQPPHRLAIRLTSPAYPREFYVEERYILREEAGATLLNQEIVVFNSAVNMFWRFLMWLIKRFGKPTGQKYLEKLKELIEGGR